MISIIYFVLERESKVFLLCKSTRFLLPKRSPDEPYRASSCTTPCTRRSSHDHTPANMNYTQVLKDFYMIRMLSAISLQALLALTFEPEEYAKLTKEQRMELYEWQDLKKVDPQLTFKGKVLVTSPNRPLRRNYKRRLPHWN